MVMYEGELPLAVICGDCPKCGYATLYLWPEGWHCAYCEEPVQPFGEESK